MSAIFSDEEELLNGLGSQVVLKSNSGNHMARTRKRWSSGSLDKKPSLINSIDHVHTTIDIDYISPGQLYSTESRRLFHAGKILIVLVGLPATSKTLMSVAITRYTRWLGVRTNSFHVSEYRREMTRLGCDKVPEDYFSAKPSTKEGLKFRKKIITNVIKEMLLFFQEGRGQVAVYDALNIVKEERKNLADIFSNLNVKVLFIESVITDLNLLKKNIEMAIKSEDYLGWSKKDAETDYCKRINVNKQFYSEMVSQEGLSYVKYYNFGERLIVNNNNYGYLINKIVFFLMNLRDKKGCIYFARCGTSDADKYIDDEVLNDEGIKYSDALTKLVLKRINERRKKLLLSKTTPEDLSKEVLQNSSSPVSPLLAFDNCVTNLKERESTGNILPIDHSSKDDNSEESFVVWTAPRKRTYDTAMFFQKKGITVLQRPQLQQLHPGLVADLPTSEIKKKFFSEYQEYLKDPYHYRFPRAESYHDLAVRMEPLLLEMERACGDILIIGHESTLRVLYGYLMACSCSDIPSLEFTRDELIEISFSPFENTITRIPILTN